MASQTIIIDLGVIGRANEHHQSDEMYKLEISLWSEIIANYSSRSYNHEGILAKVEADWSSVREHLSAAQNTNKEFHRLLKEKGEVAWAIYDSSLENPKVQVLVTLEGNNDLSKHKWYPVFFVEKYIYDTFFIANLALPGSCEFLNVRFPSERGVSTERYGLSSCFFEMALHDFFDNKDTSIQLLPLGLVADWYENLGLGVRQKADSSIEKAIFSLLHICKSDGDETSIIWIFHALEAIYGTRVGEGFSNIIDRMAILLELNSKQKASSKKKLRRMYDFRSSLVHGGYEVHHPLRNEVLDKRLNDDYLRTYDLIQYGFNVIVASLQKLIERDWYGVEVEVQLGGIGIPNKSKQSDAASDTVV
ncbi:MAG: hypothetical protein LAT53_05835 [Idiomarina sp.]|nr:hypothetical protein [Idiomarina sp.]